jgi:hypothetical protein
MLVLLNLVFGMQVAFKVPKILEHTDSPECPHKYHNSILMYFCVGISGLCRHQICQARGFRGFGLACESPVRPSKPFRDGERKTR